MGTATLACLVLRENGMTARMLGSVLTPPPPAVTVPPPTQLGAALVDVNAKIDFFYLDILSVVALGSWSQC